MFQGTNHFIRPENQRKIKRNFQVNKLQISLYNHFNLVVVTGHEGFLIGFLIRQSRHR